MMLIERGLRQDMAAEIAVEFPPTGVCLHLRAPLPQRRPTLTEAGSA
jgi:hypothetical protein